MEPIDLADANGNISIFKLLTYPRYPRSDPRHLPLETRDRLAQIAIMRMQATAETTSETTQRLF